eukprot:g3626.t1
MSCFRFCAFCVALIAVLLGILMWDTRSADTKADSILFSRQTFDHTFHLPSRSTTSSHSPAERQPRHVHFDLPGGEPPAGGKLPIIFLIHGKTSNADDMKTLFGPEAVARARKEGFVVAYPVGEIKDQARTWNAGGVDAHNDADDVAYFSAVVQHLAENHGADPQSVFLAGMSNGGFMVNRLACAWGSGGAGGDSDGSDGDGSDGDGNSGDQEKDKASALAATTRPRVRAIAPTLGGLARMKYNASCGGAALRMGGVPVPGIRVFDQARCPYRYWKDEAPAHFACDAARVADLPVMMIMGGQDLLVPLSGSVTAGAEVYPPAEYTLRFYAEANGCRRFAERDLTYRRQASPQAPRASSDDEDTEDAEGSESKDVTVCHSIRECRANTTLCVSENSGHNWVTPTNGADPAPPSRFLTWLFGPYGRTMDTGAEILDFFARHRRR